MPAIRLLVIPKPAEGTRTVFEVKTPPTIKGSGNLRMICDKCEEILVDGVLEGQIRNIVIRCPKCGSYCEIP